MLVRSTPRAGASIIPHARPRRDGAAELDPRTAIFDLTDAEALAACLAGATTVVQLIGTTRRRFAQGDTYASSDVGTTRLLVDGARAAGTIDHFILLSSVGAGRPVGAYLRAKAEAERLVRDSGLPYTIFRPSAFVGEGHHAPPGLATVTRLFGMSRYRPIAVEALAAAILRAALERAPLGEALEGDSLFGLVERGGELRSSA